MKVCVLGAGTMGSGIAAHLANLNFEVILFDINADIAKSALSNLEKQKPPYLYHPAILDNITPASLEDSSHLVANADWICEAVSEKFDIKCDVYNRIAPHVTPNSMLSTNTSGIEINRLSEILPRDLRRRFMGVHFFNPPRYLKLIELIPAKDTARTEVDRMVQFLEKKVGRRVIIAKDTPGFIANRFGMWSMYKAVQLAEKHKLTVEETDFLTGPLIGRPNSASFRLNDIVGLDIMEDIAKNILERCTDDPYLDTFKACKSIKALIEKGCLGNKSGKGYYKKENDQIHAIDLQTMAYRPIEKAHLPTFEGYPTVPLEKRLKSMLKEYNKYGWFLKEFLEESLYYANYLKEEVSHSVQDFDSIMEWGFGWKMGPFKMIDAIEGKTLNISVPQFYKNSSTLNFSGKYIPITEKEEYKPIDRYQLLQKLDGFNVRNLGDGVKAICLTGKMGVLDGRICASITEEIKKHAQGWVVCSESKCFSAGFNLEFFLKNTLKQDWNNIDNALVKLQNLTEVLAANNTVAAVHHYCLGAGLEVASACHEMVVHPEAKLGFPEIKVGLLPAGAGTSRMRLWYQNDLDSLEKTIQNMIRGAISSNGYDALKLGYVRSSDTISSHPDTILFQAKHRVMEARVQPKIKNDWITFEKDTIESEKEKFNKWLANHDFTPYTKQIASYILCIAYDSKLWPYALNLERIKFLNLLQDKKTVDRIKHMLECGKYLEN